MALALGLMASVFAGPWFALYRYSPNGWHATWWARLALLLALVYLVLVVLDLSPPLQVAAAALAGAAVAFRLIWPPDFGLAFDGLAVPTARRPASWVALGLALASLVLAIVRWRSADERSRSSAIQDRAA